MIVYRHADPRFPFLCESANTSRIHPMDWAEFLRHEGITQESELVNVRRAL